jgi:hypothetical protein
MSKFGNWEKSFEKIGMAYKVLFLCIGFVILLGVMYCFYADIVTSYRGWGKLAITAIDSGDVGPTLAWVAAFLPTGIQVLFWISKVGDIKIATGNSMFTAISYASTLFDCGLDIVRFYKGDPMSIVVGAFTTVVFFTLLSEVLFSFLAPAMYALVGATMDDLSESSTPGAVLTKAAMANRPGPRDTGGRSR